MPNANAKCRMPMRQCYCFKRKLRLKPTHDESIAIKSQKPSPSLQQDGCCGGRDRRVCAQVLTDLVSELFFDRLGTDLPSHTRWYTFAPHLAIQAGAFFCHQLLPRVLSRAFSQDGSQRNEDDENDYRAHCHKQQNISLELFAQQDVCSVTLGFALLGTWPVDRLSHRIQRLDVTSNSMTELTDTREGNKLTECLQIYWGMHNSWHESDEGLYTQVVLAHMDANGVPWDAQHDGLRRTLVSMAAGVWSRLVLRCLCFLSSSRILHSCSPPTPLPSSTCAAPPRRGIARGPSACCPRTSTRNRSSTPTAVAWTRGFRNH